MSNLWPRIFIRCLWKNRVKRPTFQAQNRSLFLSVGAFCQEETESAQDDKQESESTSDDAAKTEADERRPFWRRKKDEARKTLTKQGGQGKQRLDRFALPGWQVTRGNIMKMVAATSGPQGQMQGTTGSEAYIPLREDYERFLPTIETHKQLFNGVPYAQIPICYIKASRNNTIIKIADYLGRPLCNTSALMEGFKNAKKKSEIAGHAAGLGIAQRAMRRGIEQVRVRVKGLGPGRMSSVKAIAQGGVRVISISDYTPLKDKGPKPKKRRHDVHYPLM